MPKEIDESKLNYNKYPGEHVVEYEGVVTVGGDKVFHIVKNYKEAFNAEKLEQRFSELFDKYDYIVGDWGFEQLRLKGFFSTSRKKMASDSKIDHLEDYINEYCNYGCPYFVLRRIRTRPGKKEAFISEKVFEEKESRPVLDRPQRNKSGKARNRNRENQVRDFDNSFEVHEKDQETFVKIPQNKSKRNWNHREKRNSESYSKPKKTGKKEEQTLPKTNHFVIRTRKD